MDRAIDSNLYEMSNGILPTSDASLTSFTTTTTNPAHAPFNHHQMLGDWGLDVILNDFPRTMDSSFTTTPTITTPALDSNNQMLDDWDLDEVLNGFPPAMNSSFTTTTPTITTPAHAPLNSHQMMGDWGLDAILNDFRRTMESSFATTTPTITTPVLPTNNNQTLEDWGLDVVLNGFPRTINSSFTTTTPTTTTPVQPSNNNRMLDDWGLGAIVNGIRPTSDSSFPSLTTTSTNNHPMLGDLGMFNDFYPNQNASLSSSVTATTRIQSTNITTPINTPTTFVPTIANSQHVLIDNYQALDNWNPPRMGNGFCSNIDPPFVGSNTFNPTPTTPTINNHFQTHTLANWSNSTSLLGNEQNSSFGGESLNLHQPIMNGKNIQQMLNNNPLNISKAPLTSKNWPIFSLPFVGKLTDTPTHTNPQKQKQQHHPISNKRRHNFLQAQPDIHISPSLEWKKAKRTYKMPEEALQHDVWSWKKYGEKVVDGSPYPRVYYKCDSTIDCEAKRRVEQDSSDPSLVHLKYTGHHNHPAPLFSNLSARMNPVSTSGIGNNHPSSSNAVSQTTVVALKDDCIFEGLGQLVDLEKKS